MFAGKSSSQLCGGSKLITASGTVLDNRLLVQYSSKKRYRGGATSDWLRHYARLKVKHARISYHEYTLHGLIVIKNDYYVKSSPDIDFHSSAEKSASQLRLAPKNTSSEGNIQNKCPASLCSLALSLLCPGYSCRVYGQQ